MALEFCSREDRSFDAKEFSRDETGRLWHQPPGQARHLADRTTRRPRKSASARRARRARGKGSG
jgi:hypothetical protein